MNKTAKKLDELLVKTKEYIAESNEKELSYKEHSKKWSKKEIIGHLIDSGINNTKRFTSVLIEDEPYRIKPVKQVELVQVNDYQNSEIEELITLLLAINFRIKKLMLLQNKQTLATKIELYTDGNISDLRYLMEDYVDHFEKHVKQILKPVYL